MAAIHATGGIGDGWFGDHPRRRSLSLRKVENGWILTTQRFREVLGGGSVVTAGGEPTSSSIQVRTVALETVFEHEEDLIEAIIDYVSSDPEELIERLDPRPGEIRYGGGES